MTTGLNFWDTQVWSFVMTITLLLVSMMAANTLTNTVPFIKKLMIPSSVLGGFMLLLFSAILKNTVDITLYNRSTLEMLTYHGLGLGFVAMTLRRNDDKSKGGKGRAAFDSGATVVGGYLIQAIFGLGITLGLSYVINSFFASGLLLPMGFGQGPGQAYNWGRTYENTYGFVNGTSFGLSVAAVGFIAASVGGIIRLNVLRRKGLFNAGSAAGAEDESIIRSDSDEIPLSDSIDKFTVQVALVLIGYAMAYGIMMAINAVINTGILGNFGYNTVQPLVWGFNFLFGTVCALILKAIMGWLRKRGIMHREYTNNFMQSRISGFMFDIMVIASIASINLDAFKETEFVLPLTLICVVGAVVTYYYLMFLCPRIYPDYSEEAFLSLYGMLTGTASTGVILLREVDPQFKTQASDNIVYHQVWAIAFGFPMLLLLGVAPQGVGRAWLTLGICLVLFIAINVLLLRDYIFKKRASPKDEESRKA